MNEPTNETERTLSRKKENIKFLPVIVKRIDHTSRHPDDILELAIREGIEQHKRPWLSLFLSSLSAGLILGFAGMCVALMNLLLPSSSDFYLNRLAIALVYPLGFIVAIISGTQLFTGHTATALYPVLDRRIKVKSVFRLWFIVLIGNILGTFLSSMLLYMSDSMIVAGSGYLQVYSHLLSFSTSEVFFGAILAGWLMAQAGWLILASPSTTGQIVCIYFITFIIGFGGLHHSIAGASEVFSGLLHAKQPMYSESCVFLLRAISGNILGGAFFVGILNYAHIKKNQ